MFRQFLRDHHTTRCSFHDFINRVSFFVKTVNASFDFGVNSHNTIIKSMFNFRHCGKDHTFTRRAFTHQSDVIKTKDNILRRHNNW